MSKGRRVPPKEDLDARAKREIEFFFSCAEQSISDAYSAIKDMALDQVALDIWEQTYRYGYAQLSGYDPISFEPGRADYIYLFRSRDRYKIGTTRNIPKRVSSLQTGNPYSIELVDYSIAIGGEAVEREIHKHFNGKRVSGEWFALTDEDVATIRRWFRSGIPTFMS